MLVILIIALLPESNAAYGTLNLAKDQANILPIEIQAISCQKNTRLLFENATSTYETLLQNSTVPDAIEEILKYYNPSPDLVETMWTDLISFVNFTDPDQWNSTLIIFDQILGQQIVSYTVLSSFAQDIYSQFTRHASELCLDTYNLTLHIAGDILQYSQIDSYILSSQFLSNFMENFYQFTTFLLSNYNNTIANTAILLPDSQVTNINITISDYITIIPSINESQSTSSLIIVSFYNNSQTFLVVGISVLNMKSPQRNSLENVTIAIEIPNHSASIYSSCEYLRNDHWDPTTCLILDRSSDKIRFTANTTGLFGINFSCGTQFGPSAIVISLISLSAVCIPLFLYLDHCKLKRDISIITASYQSEVKQNDGEEKDCRKETGELIMQGNILPRRETSEFIRQGASIIPPNSPMFAPRYYQFYILYPCCSRDFAVLLRVILIYLTSVLMQIGLVLIITSTTNESMHYVPIGVISAFIAGIVACFIQYFEESESKFIMLVSFAAQIGLVIFFSYSVFERTEICGLQWAFSFGVSLVFDLFAVQIILMIGRKLLHSRIIEK